ncbi:Lipase [Cyberlindnera fabianii]|uniref:triacylglycerol lipase n=1 Tax=Cyberlindnera fabianii TaxID=36022 RepID=A0A1V2L820_CYBFA|nr:Lipase [Cyberlindnera fabianii]
MKWHQLLLAPLVAIVLVTAKGVPSTSSSPIIPKELYNDIVHYSHFCKLTHCIDKPGMLNEGLLFPNGGCSIDFCKKSRNTQALVHKIHIAGADESGTAFITVDKENNEIVVAFRASVTTADWISDFYIRKTPYKPITHCPSGVRECEGCKVHQGFYLHMNTIYDDLVNSVLDIYNKHPEFKLVLVGHSLGAALATLTAIEFKMMGFYPHLYTYGGPRIFNLEMMRWVNEVFECEKTADAIRDGTGFTSGFLRVVHEGDYVPILPPSFFQAGTEILIAKNELPHEIKDLNLIGVEYDNVSKKTTDGFWKILHGFEHRTYFVTLNQCWDVDNDETDVESMENSQDEDVDYVYDSETDESGEDVSTN